MNKTLCFAAFLIFITGYAQAQTAEEIVAKHLAAIGGDNWARVEAVKYEAQVSTDATPGVSIKMDIVAVRDKSMRIDVSVMGMTQTTVIDGDTGWSINLFEGRMDVQPLTADQINDMKDITDIDGTLVGYEAKGYTIEYVGTENVTGTKAIKIKVTKGNKGFDYSFFDPATYYEIKTIHVKEIDGKATETTRVHSNFKKQDGIVFPFTMQQVDPVQGNATTTFTSISINPLIDVKIFSMPTK